jgi:hypothetical protein
MKPRGIQRSRAKGWRLPPGAICVDRSTAWGNPFVVGRDGTAQECFELHSYLLSGLIRVSSPTPSVEEQRTHLKFVREHIEELRGHDLACWCGLAKPCHRNTLLQIANGIRRRRA